MSGQQSSTDAKSDELVNVRDIVGLYGFRFNGFTVQNGIAHRLAGVGQFNIDGKGMIRGRHRASITPLRGQKAVLKSSLYEISGHISLDGDFGPGTGHARMHLSTTSPGAKTMNGNFFVQVAGALDRLWLVSAADLKQPEETHADDTPDELVEVEAVRLSLSSAA